MSNLPETEEKKNRDEDQEFVFLCQKGDLAAFEVLVKKHQKKMLNTAYGMIFLGMITLLPPTMWPMG